MLLLVATHTASGGAGTTIFRSGFEALPLATVQEVQAGEAVGGVVLVDTVVTALSSDGKHLWIADFAQAEPYLGVYVFRGSFASQLPLQIVVGAHVGVAGEAIEFDLTPTGDTLTEISNASVTFVSAPQATPSPLGVVTVAALASIIDGEPYEGVLVTIYDVRVSSLGSMNRVTVTDNAANSIVLDDDAGGYGGGTPVVGTCYASVTGVMHLNTTDDERRLLPRGAADLVTGGSCN